jgi:D-alanyl-D-alanine carboxypeptidase
VSARVEAIDVARRRRGGFGRMIVAGRLALMVVVTALVGVGCGTAFAAASTGAAAKRSRAARITAIVKRSVVVPSQVNGVVYGVWQHGHRIVTGALGKAQAGAGPAEHARPHRQHGLVDADHHPAALRRPGQAVAQRQALEVVSEPTQRRQDHDADAGRQHHRLQRLRHHERVQHRPARRPLPAIPRPRSPRDRDVQAAALRTGDHWAFSDTNFLLLGQVLEKVGRKPIEVLQREQIFKPAGLTHTAATRSTAIPPPVLHAYTYERGPYEESTYWTGSWIPGVANVTSTAGDMGKWGRARGTGTLLSKKTHATRLAPNTAGLGPMTRSMYYTFGTAVSKRWIVNNPQILGYTGIVAYNLRRDLAVAIFTTQGPQGDIAEAYATAIYEPLAKYLTPRDVPPLSALPRGQSGNQ